MKYERIERATFLERPNRFIAYAKIVGKQETIHVKNTGRCAELLVPEAEIFVQESDNPERKTKWDLIGVRKGDRLINMDSQIPNKVVEEWLHAGNLFLEPVTVRPETTYGNSRFDFYVESGEKKAFIEVKGVTLEEDGVVRFPDAPSERAVKHVEELIRAKKEGYDAYVFLVIQMKGVRYFTPNMDTQPEFGEVLKKAKAAGVKILAYDCQVTEDSIKIDEEVPVVLENPILWETVDPIVAWYRENKRDLPWRHDVTPYRVWVSEIMLQQTRVEAVKPYYDRFLKELPTITDLANAKEDRLMKLWEGLGYYNRARNLKKAAQVIVHEYEDRMPSEYQELLKLPGIGSYTAGAIASIAFGKPVPAVDGNVLRVISRVTASRRDILKASTKKWMEDRLRETMPQSEASDFNQGLIEIGAIVCVPNGQPKCGQCPLASVCLSRQQELWQEIPVKTPPKKRRIEEKTVCILECGHQVALKKREDEGLLASLYELPNAEGFLSEEELGEAFGIMPELMVQIEPLPQAKHIFSHVEWHMKGYRIRLSGGIPESYISAGKEELKSVYALPGAFGRYTKLIK